MEEPPCSRNGSCRRPSSDAAAFDALCGLDSNAGHCGNPVQVAYNMSGWRTFAEIMKTSPKSDVTVLVLTFSLTVIFDLVVAIAVGTDSGFPALPEPDG